MLKPSSCSLRQPHNHADDLQAPPVGTLGTVIGVDDTGSIMVDWDTGSGLNVVYGEDVVRKV